MKLKKAMMSLAAATAAGLCISAYAANPEKGQSGTLNLADPVTNATAVASGSTLTTTGGNWVNPPIAENSYIVIDCEEGVTNEFTTTARTTEPVVQCDFELQVAPVPENLRPTSAPGAQTAFCVCVVGNATNFWAYVSSGWEKLEGVTVPAAETDYSLRVTFDYKNTTKYVKFSVKTEGSTYTDLHDADGEVTDIWFETASSNTGVNQYCFVGSGNVKSFAMAQCAVEAEQIPITPPGGSEPIPMVIPEEAIAAFGGESGSAATAATELVKTADNGKTVLENYVVFGQKALDKEITSTTKPVAKISTKTDASGNIPLSFQNLDVKNVPGTSVSYQLMGADTAGGTFTAVGDPVSDAADVKIPSSTTKKVFKVQVNVNYTPAN